MFESQYYLDRIAERGLATAPGYLPLVHFLTYGVEARIVPTKLFSEEYYQRHTRMSPQRGYGVSTISTDTGFLKVGRRAEQSGRLRCVRPRR